MGKRKPVPDAAQEANIVDRYDRGQTVEFITFATDFTRAAVEAVLNKHGRRGRHGRSLKWSSNAR